MSCGVRCFKYHRFSSLVPPTAPANPTAIPLSPHSVQLSWEPLAEEDVPGELVKYTVKYHRKHHGGHPMFVHIEPNRYATFVETYTSRL